MLEMLVLVLVFITVITDAKLVYKTPKRTIQEQEIVTRSIPDIYQTTTDLIEGVGLIAETHEVTTSDGYILHVHRLPSSTLNRKKVALLLHGLGSSSDNWMLTGKKSLPYILQKEGYDVWLGSSRGSAYSRGHIKYKHDEDRYCSYSLHEIGFYDNAAFIDLALNVTGAQKVFLIGYSRGTTTSYILLSSRPEYNDKVKLMVSYAPSAYFNDRNFLFRTLRIPGAMELIALIGLHSLLSISGKAARAERVALCQALKLIQDPFSNDINLLVTKDYLIDRAKLCFFLAHSPDGVCWTELRHYLQIAKTDTFMPLNRGTKMENLARYNTSYPNKYDLSLISAPVSFHYSQGDEAVSQRDLMKLIRQITNSAGVFEVKHRKFSHLNFIAGLPTDELLYKPTIRLMESFL